MAQTAPMSESSADEPWLLYEHSARAPSQLPARVLAPDGGLSVGMPVAAGQLVPGEPGRTNATGSEGTGPTQREPNVGNLVYMFPDPLRYDKGRSRLFAAGIAGDLGLVMAMLIDSTWVAKEHSGFLVAGAVIGIFTAVIGFFGCYWREPRLLGLHAAAAAAQVVLSPVNMQTTSQLLHALAQGWLLHCSQTLRAELVPAWFSLGNRRLANAA